MKNEELVTVMVPKSRLAEVYALLGSEPPAEPKAEPAVIEKAVQESPEDTKHFLHLLAASPGVWLSIEEVREKLGLGVHELAGVLSTLPRRWRGRYDQSAPLPFEVKGQGSERRYRMEPEVAEVVMSAPPAPEWTLERFRAMVLDQSGPDAVTVLEDCLAWAERHGGKYVFGKGATLGPIRFVVPDHAGQPVKALSLNTTEGVGVQYIYLKDHPPYDEEAERRDLTLRLNELHGISIPDGRWNRNAFYVKLELLSSPADRAAFFGIFDDVARRLAGFSS